MQKIAPYINAFGGMKLRTLCVPALLVALGVLMSADSAYASADISTVAKNMTNSATKLPGLITALAYGLGLMLGVSGIVKIKEHVDNPNQTPMRSGIGRLIIGGGMFSLPIVYEAMRNTIGNQAAFVTDTSGGGVLTTLAVNILGNGLGGLAGANGVFINIGSSLTSVPGLLTAGAYLLGLLFGVAGLLKLREHVETPEQVQLKEPVIRLLAGGAMFALPIMFQAAKQTIDGNGGITNELAALFLPSAVKNARAGIGACTSVAYTYGALFAGGSLGDTGNVICGAVNNTAYLPSILSLMAYLFGVVLVIWGVLKIKDNVINPQQTSLWEGVSRLVAGGAFFASPYLIQVVADTLNGGLVKALLNGFSNTGFAGATTGSGLDAMMVNFTADIFGPMLFALNFFGYIAGFVLLLIGISRLLKSAQEGPRGPGGLGTIMTFLAAGAMISISPMIGSMGATFFGANVLGFMGTDTASTQATLQYTTGMNATEIAHVQAVVSSILMFMIVLGVVAFLRGIYIIREVAEGNSQASLMAGITHIVGGALAVNLGPVMNAIQTTLGLTAYGVNFS